MPQEFWMIDYGNLVWDRTILGFVPLVALNQRTEKEVMERYWFTKRGEAEAQLAELRALSCHHAKINHYELKNTSQETEP